MWAFYAPKVIISHHSFASNKMLITQTNLSSWFCFFFFPSVVLFFNYVWLEEVRKVDATNIDKIYDFISRIDTLLHKAKQVNFNWVWLGWSKT